MSAAVGRVVGLVTALLIVLAGALVPFTSAHAAGTVGIDVVGRSGAGAVADPQYLTELALTGSGFQGVRNGHGGIYVFFGTVDGDWRPSQGGATGADYRYVYDDESAPVGYQLFTAFEGSSTGAAANGGTIDSASGTWAATIKVPGARFQAYDRDGAVTTVDCTQVQCGIITIGAHGVVNANNETFTPVRFESLYSGEAAPAAPAPRAGSGGAASPGEAAPAAPSEAEADAVEPSPSASAIPVAEPEPSSSPLAATAVADRSATPIVVVGVLGALLLAALAFAAWALARARRRAGVEAAPAEPTP